MLLFNWNDTRVSVSTYSMELGFSIRTKNSHITRIFWKYAENQIQTRPYIYVNRKIIQHFLYVKNVKIFKSAATIACTIYNKNFSFSLTQKNRRWLNYLKNNFLTKCAMYCWANVLQFENCSFRNILRNQFVAARFSQYVVYNFRLSLHLFMISIPMVVLYRSSLVLPLPL